MDTERIETAYHEAGHVVAMHALGFDLGDTSITADQDSAGRIASPHPDDRLFDVLEYMGEDGQEFMLRQVAVALSGVRAVELLSGRTDEMSADTWTQLPGSDYSLLNQWLPRLGTTGEWDAIMQRAWEQVDRVLRGNWSAVRAVEETLLEREELDAATLRSLLEESGCSRDDAPIRRVVLDDKAERLRERRDELLKESEPKNEIVGVERELEQTVRELEELQEDGEV